jgi:hypothetical protein
LEEIEMGKPVSSNAQRVETTPLNTKVNKEVFDNFKDYCKEIGYSMNVMLETFMRQYTNGKFELSDEDILKYKGDVTEQDTLNTTFNKEIYINFKYHCKYNGFFVKHVIIAFMEKIVNRKYVLEYVMVKEN